MPTPLPAMPRLRHPAAARGQGLLEFALILPLLLLLTLGTIEVGRMLVIYSRLSSGSKQAARYGLVSGDRDPATAGEQPFYLDFQGMRSTVRRAALFVTLTDADVAGRYERGVGVITQTVALCAPGAITPTTTLTSPLSLKDGDRVLAIGQLGIGQLGIGQLGTGQSGNRLVSHTQRSATGGGGLEHHSNKRLLARAPGIRRPAVRVSGGQASPPKLRKLPDVLAVMGP